MMGERRRMVRTTATVQNRDGIHVRPSTEICQAVAGYSGKIMIGAQGMEVELSAMGLLCLGLIQGAVVEISVDGPDETTVADALRALFEKHFDFQRQ